jgi:hypothetical protein
MMMSKLLVFYEAQTSITVVKKTLAFDPALEQVNQIHTHT